MERHGASEASAELAEILLEHGFSLRFDRPAELLELATLAGRVAELAGAAPLEVRAAAHVGNARRIQGDLAGSRVAFAEARRLQRRHHLVDGVLLAEIDRLESSLLRDGDELEEAARLLERALLLYRLRGMSRQAASVLQKLGLLHDRQGRPDEARAAFEEELDLLDPVADADMVACVRQNLVALHVGDGQAREARRLLAEEQSIAAPLPGRTNRLRTRWLEGRIAQELGELEQAVALFRAALDGFDELGVEGDAALVRLDLAETYSMQGHHTQALELARGLAPVMVAGGRDPESRAVLALLERSGSSTQ